MQAATLEHINLTVQDPDKQAKTLCALFGWKIRWSGTALNNGYTVHVGNQHQYIAFYTHDQFRLTEQNSVNLHNLNHLALTVDDIDATERAVTEMGITPFNFGDYQPGRRFYFLLDDNLEIEVVSYKPTDN